MSLAATWRDLSHLSGDPLLRAIEEIDLLGKMRVFMPVLVGAHALGFADVKRPVQLLCEVYAEDSFIKQASSHFGKLPRFATVDRPFGQRPATWIRFKAATYSFELIGQAVPVDDQPLLQATAMAQKLIRLSNDPLSTRRELAASLANLSDEADEFEPLCVRFGLPMSEGGDAKQSLIALLDVDETQLKALSRQSVN
jgi:hypothetical protein